jgi:hypothetical protein
MARQAAALLDQLIEAGEGGRDFSALALLAAGAIEARSQRP